MESLTSFIKESKTLSVEDGKAKLSNIIKELNLPEDFTAKIINALSSAMDALKAGVNAKVDSSLKSLNDILKAGTKQGNFMLHHCIGALLLALSQQMGSGATKLNVVSMASEQLQLATADNDKHIESIVLLRDAYRSLTQLTNGNQQGYYSGRLSDFEKIVQDIEQGRDFKLPLSSNTKILQAYSLKDKGAESFKTGDYKQAIFNYYSAKNFIMGLQDLNQEKTNETKALKHVLLNNIAMCLMKQQKYTNALRSLEEILLEDADNVKALYRRGKCQIVLENYSEAETDLLRAKSLAPNDKEILNELAILAQKTKSHNAKESKAYSKIFD
ncbi:hypothetical protein SAMD00019534_085680 [Acytostelium subglobosum LB1]|uniref:hypothetical protein n=1 Tax=Acytostelium subglobosum LB1 TaxID=1410327 RepID=UPI000644E837|nr:hypothetical protein SAMD00019534_085680 [Acytostelium subglobosum LB1]GAM25393.1 hypothetical protein SAMD00019534_085680 [Acytostelium subglobosum LB1]|eukprot:XP_012751913.1 hypothetical protein SAMD00019534_085680 [Acytostelium subglobosum LB1]